MAERQYTLTTPITIASDTIRIERVEADKDGLVIHYKIGVVDGVTGRFNVRERASVRADKSALPAAVNQARRDLIRAYDVLIAQAGLGTGVEGDEPPDTSV